MFTCNFCGVFCTDHGQLPQNIDVLGQTTTFQDVCKNSESMKLFPSFILIANWLKYLYYTKLDYNNNSKHLFNTQEKAGSKKYTSSKLIFF